MKHPKLILFLLNISAFLILLLAAEKTVAVIRPIQSAPPAHVCRYIRLSENYPNYSDTAAVTPEMARNVDLSERTQAYPLRSDENGFLMPSKIHSKPDRIIVFLGGSTTECMYMEEKNRFPYLAGRLLEQSTGLKVNSYNAGFRGNNSLHSIDVLLNKVIPLQPDIVVMMHNVNDLVILLYEGTYWNNNIDKSPIIEVQPKPPAFKDLLRPIKDAAFPHLYRLIRDLTVKPQLPDQFAHTRGKKITIDQACLIKEFKANLQTFIGICRSRGILPVLMTQANRLKEQPDEVIARQSKIIEDEHGIRYKDFKALVDIFNQVIRDVGRENNIPVIDLAKAVPQDKAFLYDTVHLNDEGSKLVSQFISGRLKKILSDYKL